MTDPATTTPDVIGDTARWLKSHDWAYWAIIGGAFSAWLPSLLIYGSRASPQKLRLQRLDALCPRFGFASHRRDSCPSDGGLVVARFHSNVSVRAKAIRG